MKRIALVLSAAALACSFAPSRAVAQDEWVAQVRRQLQQYGQAVEGRGYSMTHRIYTGSLDQGNNEMVSLTLEAGTQYQIMGACDNDCTDLDFVLYDSNGNELDSDLQTDDYPVVSVTPRRTGTYSVKVIMATCSREPCRYGVGVFGK